VVEKPPARRSRNPFPRQTVDPCDRFADRGGLPSAWLLLAAVVPGASA